MQTIQLILSVADITTLNVDVIVNAANPQLRRGGGVCGAIHAAAGPELERECLSLYPDGIQPGQAVPTGGHNSRAKWIIHAVAPVSDGSPNQNDFDLQMAFANSIRVASELGAKSMAIPSLGTGIYGWKIPEIGFRIMKDAIPAPAFQSPSLETVILCCFSEADADAYWDFVSSNPDPWKRLSSGTLEA